MTPWGKPTKGCKTRSKKKPSNKFIVKRRKTLCFSLCLVRLKGPFVDGHLLKKVAEAAEAGQRVKTWSRRSTFSLISSVSRSLFTTVSVVTVYVTENMIGHNGSPQPVLSTACGRQEKPSPLIRND